MFYLAKESRWTLQITNKKSFYCTSACIFDNGNEEGRSHVIPKGKHNIHNSLSNFPRKPYHILDKQYSLLTNNLSVGWLKRTPREIENIFNDFVIAYWIWTQNDQVESGRVNHWTMKIYSLRIEHRIVLWHWNKIMIK